LLAFPQNQLVQKERECVVVMIKESKHVYHGGLDGNMDACGMQGFCSESKGPANNEANLQRADLGIFTPAQDLLFISKIIWQTTQITTRQSSTVSGRLFDSDSVCEHGVKI
jgi:hypothetical protein